MKFPKRRQEVATEFGYPMYAEGLARALDFLKPLGVPIEITENGVADANDTLRTEHLKRHLWVLSKRCGTATMSARTITGRSWTISNGPKAIRCGLSCTMSTLRPKSERFVRAAKSTDAS